MKDIRAFLLGMVEQAERRPPGGDPAAGHPLVQKTRLNIRLLGALPRPELPLELRQPAFLDSILDHAVAHSGTAPSGQDLGPFLREALPPLVAPGDVVWREAESHPGVTEGLSEALPGRPAPGWLWSRIRADLRTQISLRRRRAGRALALRLAAAVVLISVSVFGLYSVIGQTKPENDGTLVPVLPVFQEMDRPLVDLATELGGAVR